MGQIIAEEASSYRPLTLISIGLFGFAVLGHMISIRRANEVAVDKLQEIEIKLNLPPTVKSWEMNYMPFILALFIVAGVCFLYGFKIFICA